MWRLAGPARPDDLRDPPEVRPQPGARVREERPEAALEESPEEGEGAGLVARGGLEHRAGEVRHALAVARPRVREGVRAEDPPELVGGPRAARGGEVLRSAPGRWQQ